MNEGNGFPPSILSMADVDWDRLLDKPIAFHRSLIEFTGSVNAALFLSQAIYQEIYWQRRVPNEIHGVWWYKTQKQWTEETGLSRREQETARKILREQGLLMEEVRGLPPKIWYQVHPMVLRVAICDAKGVLEPRPGRQKTDSSLAIEDINWTDVLSHPIAFHRCFVGLTGSVNGAVMLSQSFYWQYRASEDLDGWWYKTQKKWTEETGLSRNEQDTARKKLREAGILQEEKRGMPAKTWYRLNPSVLRDRLIGVEEIRTPVDNYRLSRDYRNTEHPEGREFNLGADSSNLDGTNPPFLPIITLESGEFNILAGSSNLDCANPPFLPIITSEFGEFNIGADSSNLDYTNPPFKNAGIRHKDCGNPPEYYKETEIKQETTPPPQTPPPNESAGGRGGEITSLAKREDGIGPEPKNSKPGKSPDPSKKLNAAQTNRNSVFPDQLSGPERQGAQTILARYDCPDSTVQEILDVLAAIILAGEVRKSPLAVLRGLLERWKSGTFDATTGLHVAVVRRRQAEIQARMNAPPPAKEGSGQERPDPLRRSPPPGTFEALRKALKTSP